MSSTGSDVVSIIASQGELEFAEDDIDGNDLSSVDSQGQRPGRFYGPDSSWRYYTRDERGLTASLDQAVNNDLSVQLYNLHAFKAGLRDPQRALAVKAWQSKQRWAVPEDSKSRKPFQPRPRFSAWPLKPAFVPRSNETWGAVPIEDEHESAAVQNKNHEPWKPSLHLQEELKAVFLRQAKEQLLAHRKHNTRPDQYMRGRPKGSRESPITVHDTVGLSDDATSVPGSSVNSDSPSQTGESLAQQSDRERTPELISDDDVAGAILQPTVRHLISKQDELLTALHLSRRGQQHDPSAPWLKPRTSRNNSPARARSRFSIKAARKRKRGDEEDEDKSRHDQTSVETTPRLDPTAKRKRRRKLGQRDWSEVLGMAAMMGWDRHAIDRAARRCAAIFEEGMSMRFVTGDLSTANQDRVVDYLPDMVPIDDDDAAPDERSQVDGNAFYCPHSSCDRYEQPYMKRWRLREHLRRKHKHTNEEIERLGSEYAIDAGRNIIEISSAAAPSSSDIEEP
jgi:hypothetical protein